MVALVHRLNQTLTEIVVHLPRLVYSSKLGLMRISLIFQMHFNAFAEQRIENFFLLNSKIEQLIM